MFDTKLSYEMLSRALYGLTRGERFILPADVAETYTRTDWDAVTLGVRPNTNAAKPTWDAVMEAAREIYLNNYNPDAAVADLRERCQRHITDIYGAHSLDNEWQLRKSAKVETLQDITRALSQIIRATGVSVAGSSYLLSCEAAAKEKVQMEYRERKRALMDSRAAAELYAASNADFNADHILGCLHFSSLRDGLIILRNSDGVQIGAALGKQEQRFSIAEVSDGNHLLLDHIPGEHIASGLVAATIINRSNQALTLRYADESIEELFVDNPADILVSNLPVIITAGLVDPNI